LTKAATALALICALIAGGSAASILARAAVPAAGSAGVAAIEHPIANRDSKTDKLGAAAQSQAADDELAAATTSEPEATAATKPVQLAYAADDADALPPAAAAKSEAAPATKLPPVIATAPMQKPKPKPATKDALLSDNQIAQIKTRLNLSSSQEYYWPSVEQALRAIGRKLHAIRRDRDSGAPAIDPDSAEVQQLKFAAMPLLFQLREDQKQEVRKLARAMGLDQVAQQI
jgi:hypothetical protein